MWFRNLQLYRLPANWPMPLEDFEAALAKHPLVRCGNLDMESHGWVHPRGNGVFVHALNKHWLVALGVEQKLLPGSVINQVAAERAAEIAEERGFGLGRKELRELKERVAEELRPRAFTRRRTTWAWIDPQGGWLVVDAASPTKADEVLETLRRAVDEMPLSRLHTATAPGTAMTGWVAGNDAPAGFTIDQDLELRAPDENRATVRYVRHDLAGKEIQEHIANGKTATRLGMTWNDRISFVLTEELQIKRLAFLDILKEEAETQAGQDSADADALFDINFALMTGELSRMIADVVEALGGEHPDTLAKV